MKKSERASYLQLFKDCGWEHITDFNSFSYLEKAHSEIESDTEFEIYNDATGKHHDQTDFNNADASYFDSISSLLPVFKVCQWS